MNPAQTAVLTVLAGAPEVAHARAAAVQAVARHWHVPVQVQALTSEALVHAGASATPPRVPHVLWVRSDASLAHVAAALLRWRQVQPVAVVFDGELPAGEAWACLLGEHDVLMTARAAVQQWLHGRANAAAPDASVPLHALWQTLRTALWPRGPVPAACLQGSADADQGLLWLASAHAHGWLKPDAQRVVPAPATPDVWHMAATAVALAKGFVAADAMALGLSVSAGAQPCPLPRLSWGTVPSFVESAKLAEAGHAAPLRWPEGPSLYAIVETAPRLKRCAEHGAHIVQLRSKLPAQPTQRDRDTLRQSIADSIAAAHKAGATLFINDHRQVALELGAGGLHLGQEDLLALTELQRTALRQPRVQGTGGRLMVADWAAPGMHKAAMQRLLLGISSHSVWELARARSLAPDYVACGPVWATTTKDMPWIPQSLHNLRWWVAHAGCPVVAIGGILADEHIRQTAATGAAAVCVVRGLGDDPAQTLPAMQQALTEGHRGPRPPVPALPLPSLCSGVGVPDRSPMAAA